MKKGFIILIVVGFLFITSGIVGAVLTRNNVDTGVQSTTNSANYPNGRVRNNQNSRQYNRRTTNQRAGMMRGYNYNQNSQCPYLR